jgi:Predicted membrane protein (DUF2207)
MGPLLAEEATLAYPDLVVPLLAASVAAVVLWLVLLLAAAFATRPREVEAAPATMELGEESPAVVDLLTNDWRVTPDAVPATLLDLAARGFVDLDQHGEGRTVCRVRRTAGGGLASYERMVLDHVARLAVDGVVPAAALTTGPQDASARWWRSFKDAVVHDARARGLTRDRWSRPVERLLKVAALAPAGVAVLLANAVIGLNLGTVVVGGMLWVALTGLVKRFRDQRDTPAGAEAAAGWLGVRAYLGRNEVFPSLPPAAVAIWDRYLAYGAALGVATAALRALPMGAEDDHRAWSSYGGRWRVVRVSYPRLRLVWGRPPVVAFLVGLGAAGGGYLLLRLMLSVRGATDEPGNWVGPVASVLALAALAVLGWGGWTALRALVDLGSRREVEGQVVRLRSWQRGENERDHFAAMDDGRSGKVKAWLVPAATHARLWEGATASATVGPRLGYVFRMDLVGPPAAAGAEPAPAPAEAVGREDGAVGLLADPGVEVDPATVVTAEDAGAALGVPVGPAEPLIEQPLPVARMRGCRYAAASGDRASVSVFTAAGQTVKLLARVHRRFGEAVPGLGDQAWLRGDTVAVVRGEVMVSIRLQGRHVPDRPAALKRLAAAAAGRLAATETPA